MDLQPQQKLGKYTIVRKLAEGGMAEIYLAEQGGATQSFKRQCVVKRVKRRFVDDKKFRQMFEQEASLWAKLDHPNIVNLIEFESTSNGELYLVMQYVDGCALNQLRQQLPGQVVPPYLAATIVRDVAWALDHAWNLVGEDGEPLRLVHRDISPHNILLSRNGRVLLGDFGVAKPVTKDTSGGIKGKVAYMAPEQARGQRIDARADLFALGVVLFELVTGTRPFEAANDIALIQELMRGNGSAPRATTAQAGVPDDLADILEIALRRTPENRYQTAREFGRALEQFIASAPNDVDTDLVRFMAERLGTAAPDPSGVPQLPTGAFDETLVSERRGRVEDGVVQPASSRDATVAASNDARERPEGPVGMAAIPAVVKQGAPLRPTPKPREETPLLAAPPRPVEPSSAPGPLLTRPMKLGLAVAVPVLLCGSALFAFHQARSEARPEVIVAPVPRQPEAAVAPPKPEPAPQPEATPQPTEPPKVVLAAATQPAPAKAEPKPPEKPPEKPPKARARAHEVASAATGSGFLDLQAGPYAVPYEGAHQLCESTPCRVIVASGAHVVRFAYDGKSLKAPVTIVADQQSCLRASFEGAPKIVRCE